MRLIVMDDEHARRKSRIASKDSIRQSLVYKLETSNDNISYGFSANVAHVLFTKCPWPRSVRIINAAFTIRADR